MLKITQINKRYVVDCADGRIHILNEKALKWNLKHVFGFTKAQIDKVYVNCALSGFAVIQLKQGVAA